MTSILCTGILLLINLCVGKLEPLRQSPVTVDVQLQAPNAKREYFYNVNHDTPDQPFYYVYNVNGYDARKFDTNFPEDLDEQLKDETSTQKAETSTQKPEISTQKPETSTQKPETSTQKPETSTQKPEQPSKLKLSAFAKEVKKQFPGPTRKFLFNVNHNSKEQFLQAVHEANEADARIFNTTFPEDLDKELNEEVKKMVDTVTPDDYFAIFLNAVGKTLEDEQVLNSTNLEEVAESLTMYFEKAACSSSEANVAETLPAISSANFYLFKSLGLNSQDVLIRYIKNILKEIRKDEGVDAEGHNSRCF